MHRGRDYCGKRCRALSTDCPETILIEVKDWLFHPHNHGIAQKAFGINLIAGCELPHIYSPRDLDFKIPRCRLFAYSPIWRLITGQEPSMAPYSTVPRRNVCRVPKSRLLSGMRLKIRYNVLYQPPHSVSWVASDQRRRNLFRHDCGNGRLTD